MDCQTIIKIPVDKKKWAQKLHGKIIVHPILDIDAEYVSANRRIKVKLSGKPYINITLINESDLNIAQSYLIFTPENWDQYQYINLQLTGDGIVDIYGDCGLINSTSVSVLE